MEAVSKCRVFLIVQPFIAKYQHAGRSGSFLSFGLDKSLVKDLGVSEIYVNLYYSFN